MAQKKKKHNHGKPHGHYCKVCREYKSNEKFSGGGHSAHICKKCASLSPAERSAQETLNKIEGMGFRHLSETEINWLRNRLNDPRPEVRATARDVHNMKFPNYERNKQKKGLTVGSLEFYIHGEIYNEYGDEVSVNVHFFMDDTGVLKRIDYDAPESERETEIHIEPKDAKRFMKSVIHEMNAPFWAEDLSDADPDEYYDDDIIYGESYGEEDDSESENLEEINTENIKVKEPMWFLNLKLNKNGMKSIVFYNQMHDEPVELFWNLNSWFEPDEDDYDEEDDFDEGCEQMILKNYVKSLKSKSGENQI